MGIRIGIDFGNRNCIVAAHGSNGCKVIQNKEAEFLTPSVVGCYKSNILIGAPALNRWPMAPKDTVISIRRLMGRAFSDPEVEKMRMTCLCEIVEVPDGAKGVGVILCGNEYTPVEISAMILKKLKEDAEFTLGEEVTEVVITVPAYFSSKQMAAVREAGVKAGLEVVKIISEPIAAVISCGLDTDAKEAVVIIVFHLDEESFDVSVLIMTMGTSAILNREGDMRLGGDDFDRIIADYVIEQLKNEYSIKPEKDLRFMTALKMEAKRAKETLSAARTALIMIPGILHDNEGKEIDVTIEIAREFFEEKATPLIQRMKALTQKAVTNAHLPIEEVDFVLMSGCCSAIPAIRLALEELFGSEKMLRPMHPVYCVAQGAAMAANMLPLIKCPGCGRMNEPDARICEICGRPFEEDIIDNAIGTAPFSYGIQGAGDAFDILIKKNDPIPTPENKREFINLKTEYANQRIMMLPMFGGDHPENASANEKLGTACVILPEGLEEGTSVKMKLWLDRDGAFETCAHLEDGKSLFIWILRGGKDQKAVENTIKALKRLDCYEKEIKQMRGRLNGVIELLKQGDFENACGQADMIADIPMKP